MTSESEAKTNEYLRRRRLRIQQVREQSKDIAKKLRQRAKLEQLRYIGDQNVKKAKDYLQHQDNLVKRLEQLYAQGVKNVGCSHQKASKVVQNISPEKVDLSKLRGREAAAELRKTKQLKLEEQKKLLDRKLLAREAANEISREKSSTVTKKLNTRSTTSINPEEVAKNIAKDDAKNNAENRSCKVSHNDMATQWDFEQVPNEWEPSIPALSLPKDDVDSVKDPNNVPESKSDKSKRIDLFALSSEMPSSLRGGLSVTEDKAVVKPSLTMISEYLQSRALRLRETDTPGSSKKQADDLHSLRQTIIRTRSSKPEGTASNVCHVLDEQVIPMPSWQAESNCEFCFLNRTHYKNVHYRQSSLTNSQINKTIGSITPKHVDLFPTPGFRSNSPIQRNKACPKVFYNTVKGNDKSAISSEPDHLLTKKNSVTMYNHLTRNSRDVPCGDTGLVVRDLQEQEDAYSQALKETFKDKTKEKDQLKKIQEMRNKVAITKQSVEKEYNDTMSFLNSLPKEKCNKHMKNLHLDDRRRQILKDRHQQKLQQEFKKIEKECKKDCRGKESNKPSKSHSSQESKSPSKELDGKDLQYSWMPVPDSDDNLVIHAIPTTAKEEKAGNTVKFSKVDSYHEYRSRHKHTPPTKDTDGQTKKQLVETVLIQNDESDSIDYLESSSDTSSVENLNLNNKKNTSQTISETEKIIIYKILDSKLAKKQKERKKLKLIDDVAKVLTSMGRDKLNNKMCNSDNNNRDNKLNSKSNEEVNSSACLENINEGVYQILNKRGDNITSLNYSEKSQEDNNIVLNEETLRNNGPCMCAKNIYRGQPKGKGIGARSGSGDIPEISTSSCENCANNHNRIEKVTAGQPSAATSTSSFKTAPPIDKANSILPNGSYVKLMDNEGQDTRKFYIGASGFLKDDAYEVIIQLRKKESLNKSSEKKQDTVTIENVATSSIHENKIPDLPVPPSGTIPVKESSNEEEIESYKNVNRTEPEIISSEKSLCAKNKEGSSKQNTHEHTSTPDSSEENVEISRKNISDKDTQHSFAIPGDLPKADTIPRPATSTYTQTTINSPSLRPNFYHLSSSTSTAYLSPPEVVLPRSLRQLYSEMYNQNDVVHSQDDKNYGDSACKHCLRHQKVMLNKLNSKPSKTIRGNNINTPPNTMRSNKSEDVNNDYIYTRREATRNTYKTCHKCASRSTYGNCNGRSQRKKRKVQSSKFSSRNLVMRVSPNNSNPLKNNSTTAINKPKLNPVVKSYVNKLLEINSNGLKAIEIANQDCSSVSTPGSSIIDVPRNLNVRANKNNKISLEQIKNTLKEQILDECVKQSKDGYTNQYQPSKKSKTCSSKVPKLKKPVHKIKSLNISKKIMKSKNLHNVQYPASQDVKSSLSRSSPSSTTEATYNKPTKSKNRSRSSPTPRFDRDPEYSRKKPCSDTANTPVEQATINTVNIKNSKKHEQPIYTGRKGYILPLHKATVASPDSEIANNHSENPVNTSTQTTCQDLDSEINLIKSAEHKIQNIEKIADLTERCTNRLSNLAKVLEKVRRNKSLAYSNISTSDTASDSDQKFDKDIKIVQSKAYESTIDLQVSDMKSTTISDENQRKSPEYIPFLKDIPKPEEFKYPVKPLLISTENEEYKTSSNNHELFTKSRTKPPPALSRINLKHGQDIIPHELSTVVEVDSPMSVKLKNQSSKDIAENLNDVDKNLESELQGNPDLLQNNPNISKRRSKISSNDSSDESKIQMMDMKQFNDVMLKPFISLQEYVKQCDVGVLDEGSNVDDNVRDDGLNDELSSLHSDGSLPDVIAELLKRNIIAEPFKFDTVSNVNSTTVSSESTLSVLALSKALKEKRKTNVVFHNKENISETSDTLSISSNPDLENAFKKLGMGWASSTLKKTKERLALSSSSNTSSSSLSQFKLKTSNNQAIPALVTDSVTTINKTSKRQKYNRNSADTSRNAEQQTSFINSMTVKEFLTNELAKKITFMNTSNRNQTDQEYMSLLETKLPEEMKHSSQNLLKDYSAGSLPSGNNNRARTSTPVQIFKSMTYHSTSSSNISNGLFSNVDDLSSVKGTSNSMRNHSTSDKDDLTIPNCSLKVRKVTSDCSN